jgi:uncharacterized membrane protein YhaH (DUF805 family)
MEIGSVLKRGFDKLLDFDGRDDRRTFLTYFCMVFGALFIFSAFLFAEDAINDYEALESFQESQRGTNMTYWPAQRVIAHNDRINEQTDELRTQAVISAVKFSFVGLVLPLLLTLSSMVRRVHDIGYSGKWLFAALAVSLDFPFALIALPIALGALKSDAKSNMYGDPS